jgi:hypothetical protein
MHEPKEKVTFIGNFIVYTLLFHHPITFNVNFVSKKEGDIIRKDLAKQDL